MCNFRLKLHMDQFMKHEYYNKMPILLSMLKQVWDCVNLLSDLMV